MDLFIHLTHCLDAECGRDIRHPLVRKCNFWVLASDTGRPNAAHMVTFTTIILLDCLGCCGTTAASSVYSIPHSSIAGVDGFTPLSTPSHTYFLKKEMLKNGQNLLSSQIELDLSLKTIYLDQFNASDLSLKTI